MCNRAETNITLKTYVLVRMIIEAIKKWGENWIHVGVSQISSEVFLGKGLAQRRSPKTFEQNDFLHIFSRPYKMSKYFLISQACFQAQPVNVHSSKL